MIQISAIRRYVTKTSETGFSPFVRIVVRSSLLRRTAKSRENWNLKMRHHPSKKSKDAGLSRVVGLLFIMMYLYDVRFGLIMPCFKALRKTEKREEEREDDRHNKSKQRNRILENIPDLSPSSLLSTSSHSDRFTSQTFSPPLHLISCW
jgi:hypothetical protein